MTCIAIDPGNEMSAMLVWTGVSIDMMRYSQNDDILGLLRSWRAGPRIVPLVIEMIGHYGTGMPAGKTVFDTCVWIGRFIEAYGAEDTHTILRPTVKAHVCGSARAKDGNVRQALIDRFGHPGTKRAPGLLHGISGDLWQALAVGVTWVDQRAGKANTESLERLRVMA